MLLRFLDEGSVPATYAQRLLPWVLIAAVIQVIAGEVMNAPAPAGLAARARGRWRRSLSAGWLR